jgi:hypothetical protein
MSEADDILREAKDENSLLRLCQEKSVRTEYLPLVTNSYHFKDDSKIRISRKHNSIGVQR